MRNEQPIDTTRGPGTTRHHCWDHRSRLMTDVTVSRAHMDQQPHQSREPANQSATQVGDQTHKRKPKGTHPHNLLRFNHYHYSRCFQHNRKCEDIKITCYYTTDFPVILRVFAQFSDSFCFFLFLTASREQHSHIENTETSVFCCKHYYRGKT